MLNKAQIELAVTPQQAIYNDRIDKDHIMIKANRTIFRLKAADIILIEGLADYVVIKTSTGKYVTKSTMKDMYDRLPPDQFIRSHRSFIVNIQNIHSLNTSSILISQGKFQYVIPIGAVFKKAIKQRLFYKSH